MQAHENDLGPSCERQLRRPGAIVRVKPTGAAREEPEA